MRIRLLADVRGDTAAISKKNMAHFVTMCGGILMPIAQSCELYNA